MLEEMCIRDRSIRQLRQTLFSNTKHPPTAWCLQNTCALRELQNLADIFDTPGAYPGLEAEARGQGEAIAKCLSILSALTVPVISVVTGEGGSGGALALGVGNSVLMLENAVYSVLSPEGFAAILWKDSSRSSEACDVMKLTAADLLELRSESTRLNSSHEIPSRMPSSA